MPINEKVKSLTMKDKEKKSPDELKNQDLYSEVKKDENVNKNPNDSIKIKIKKTVEKNDDKSASIKTKEPSKKIQTVETEERNIKIKTNKFINQNERDNFVDETKETIKLEDLKRKNMEELNEIVKNVSKEMNIPNVNLNRLLKTEKIFMIMKFYSESAHPVYANGVAEISNEGSGFLRFIENNYSHSHYDIYLSKNVVRKFLIKTGDSISGYLNKPFGNERFFSMTKIESINDLHVNDFSTVKSDFDSMTPVYPNEKFNFSSLYTVKKDFKFDFVDSSTRMIDLFAPIGKGQRAIIVAPPRVGKTILLQNIAHSINSNHPDVHLIVLLIDERPEEVTDMARSVKGEVVSSTFDQHASKHVALSEIVISRAKRLAEQGKDVVILLDNITRLARAYNAVIPSSGKVLTGGVDTNALQKPKRFFGAARNIEHGGSLTIIATALIDTGSKMDEVIFEEFKGTGNSEIVLDRKLAEKRIFPAINIKKSGTRREDQMISKEDLEKVNMFRRIAIQMFDNAGQNEATSFVIDKIIKYENNEEMLKKMNNSN